MIGHCGSAVTTFPSPICSCRSDHLVQEGQICELRTIDQIVQFAEQFTRTMVNGEKANAAVRSAMMGITKPPLFLSIGFDRIIPTPYLLLSHFVTFAREHKFLGLLDEQGDKALHSVWRRLEQLWKCMPDADQILQQLEHHFVNNWLLGTGKIDKIKQRQSDQRDENDEFDQSEETDEISLINVID